MGKILRFDLFLIVAAMVLAVACSPQFNKKRAPASGGGPAGPTTIKPWGGYTEFVDQHDVGGGAQGTAANYKLSGVNITQFGKIQSSGANFKIKGGADGQLH